jgi:hypothetical protein
VEEAWALSEQIATDLFYPVYEEPPMRPTRAIVLWPALALALSGCRGAVSNAVPAAPLPAQRAPFVSAAAVRLTPIGPTRMTSGFTPNSGKVNAVAVDPANPRIIYTASGRGTGLETYSSAGIYRTRDGGASWEAIDNGLTDPSGVVSSVVNALWLDPASPNTLLAATEYDGIFRSIDGGSSWHNVYATTHATQFASFGGALYAASAAGILTSADDGATWTVSRAASAKRYPTAFGTAASTFVAGMSDGTIFSFTSGAWTKTGKLPFTASTGTDGSSPAVHQIAVDPQQPSLIYASTNDGRWDQNLNASRDGGKTWIKVVPYYKKYTYYDLGLGTQAIAFSAMHQHLLYIGLDGALIYIVADGSPHPPLAGYTPLSVIDIRDVWPSPNGGDDRCWIASDQGLDDVPACTAPTRAPKDDVVSKTLATGLARRFLVSPNGRTIVASIQDFDSHATYDGGAHWTELASKTFSLYEDGFNEMQPGNPSVCYAFDEASGLTVSKDGCHTYASPSTAATKIFPSRLMTTPMAFDPKDANKLYVISGDIVGAGFSPAPKAVFLTTDGGATLTKMPWPLDEPGAIAIDPHDSSHLLAGDLAHQKVSSLRVTFDGGKTWKTSRGVPATGFWYSMTIAPNDGSTVLATSVDAANDVFVLRSTDGGLSFKKVAVVTNAPLVRGHVDADLAHRYGGQPPAFVYSPARQILFNPDAKAHPYAALTTLRGAFLSTDNGSTWKRVDGALIAHSFWGIRWNRGYLYLGSDGQGVVKSTQPLQ